MKRFGKPTLILLGGFLLSALVFGIGGVLLRLESRLHDLQEKCLEDVEGEAQRTGIYFIPICDPEELSVTERNEGPSDSVQAKIVSAHRALLDSKSWPAAAAAIVLVLSLLPWLVFSVLPWIWYFLLRRIKELREAIVGK